MLQVKLTVTQLEAALAAGAIDGDVLVMAPGSDTWVSLASLRAVD